MFGIVQKIKEHFIKKFVVKQVVGRLEKMFAALPQDDKKTVSGIMIACIGLTLQAIPETSEYAQPILDYLHTLPTGEIVAGGLAWSTIGLFHKSLKWIIKVSGYQTAKEKEEAKIVLVNIDAKGIGHVKK